MDSRFWNLWLAVLLLAGACSVGAEELDSSGWRQPTRAELEMTQEPLAPGAAAIYLYTRNDRNDDVGWEKVYAQIKVLSEAGRDRANIEIPYRKGVQRVRDIEARVVQPDGTIVPFKGEVFDRALVSTSTVALHSKRLSLPDVRVGSIIEYHFKRTFQTGTVFDSSWLLNQDLFTRHASYSLKANQTLLLRTVAPLGWLPGTTPSQVKKNSISYESRNVPAFVTEEFMPPAVDLQYHVDFIYSLPFLLGAEPVSFWTEFAKGNYKSSGPYTAMTDKVRKALAGIVAEGDTDEQKARKIYAYVQKLPNIAFDKTPEGAKDDGDRDKARAARSVDDVIALDSATGSQLALYCIALLRAAGLPAEPVLAAPRTERFFGRNAMQRDGLDAVLVATKLGGKEVLLLAAVPYLPFGELPWDLTAVDALRIANGAEWITTPSPHSQDAITRRVADLALTEEGTLEGTVDITFSGREAFGRRMEMRLEDEVARKERLEKDLKSHLPADATVKLLEQPDLEGIDTPLQVKYSVTVPSWAVPSGGRLLVGVGLFGNAEKGVFVAPNRQHPIYFRFPAQVQDELHIKPPAGYRLQSPLAPATVPQESQMRYEIAAAAAADGVVLRRNMAIDVLLARANTYPRFQNFFRAVRAGDEQQAVLAH